MASASERGGLVGEQIMVMEKVLDRQGLTSNAPDWRTGLEEKDWLAGKVDRKNAIVGLARADHAFAGITSRWCRARCFDRRFLRSR